MGRHARTRAADDAAALALRRLEALRRSALSLPDASQSHEPAADRGWIPDAPLLDLEDEPAPVSGWAGTRLRAGAHRLRGRLPETVAGGRWALPARSAAVLVAAALVAALAAGWWAWQGRTTEVLAAPRAGRLATPGADDTTSTVRAASTAAAVPGSRPAPSTSPPGRVVVDVVGQVRRPGVVTLPADARVHDALTAAGGALPAADLQAVNLARKVVDGEQIRVPKPGEAPVAAPAATGAAAAGGAGGVGAAAGPLDLNTATVEQLDGLPGVGPVLAQRIVDWRTEHGAFRSVEELQEVTGIGPAKYGDLAPLVRS